MKESICQKCMKPKTVDNSVRITQWLSVCRCDLIDSETELYESLRICQVCHKRISLSRHGSFSQWIFRTDLCACDRPAIEETPSEPGAPATHSSLEYPELENLDSDFPSDRFKPIEILGRGANGTVYRSQDRVLKKIVVVKVLHNLKRSAVVSFQAEAQITAKLKHPNIVEVSDIGLTQRGAPFMVLEYAVGVSIKEYLNNSGPIDWHTAAEVFAQVCDGLAYAHRNGVLHRDLKPANILLAKDRESRYLVKVIDFGLARVIQQEDSEADQEHSAVGTPGYMSPDQADAQGLSEQSDIYSVGCILFECLTGRKPFSGESSVEILNQQLSNEYLENLFREPDDVPEPLKEVVRNCLRRSRHERYESADDLREDLLACLDDLELTQTRFLQRRNSRRSVRPMLVTFLAFLIVGTGLVMVNKLDSDNKPIKERPDPLDSYVRLSDSLGSFVLEEPGTLRGTYLVDDNSLKRIKDRNDIHELNLSGSIIEGSGLRYLKNLPLVNLNLNSTGVSDDDLVPLTEIGSLNRLSINRTNCTGRTMNLFKSVEILTLKECPVSNAGLESISAMPALRDLTISIEHVSPHGLSYLANNKKLKTLCLESARSNLELTEFIPALKKLSSLNTLLLIGIRVKKSDVAYLLKLRIPILHFSTGCILENGFIDEIVKGKNLERLSFEKGLLSEQELMVLKRRLSDCEILVSEPHETKNTKEILKKPFPYPDLEAPR